MLLDPGTFIEMDKYARHRSVAFGQDANRPYGDGVVTGFGTIDGRLIALDAATGRELWRYDPNHFGINEFMRFCQLSGAEAYLAANPDKLAHLR